jgi:hypothetical protein
MHFTREQLKATGISVLIWQFGDDELVAETLRERESLRDVQPIGDWGSQGKLFGSLIVANFMLTPESLAPYMKKVLDKAGPISNFFGLEDHEVEIGIYGQDDVRAWKVWRT